MTDLDLKELDRLEREASCVGIKRSNTDNAFTTATRNQLRPLLDLVEQMGEALESLETVTRSYLRYPLEGEEPGYDAKDVLAYCNEAHTVLDDYRRARGEA